MAIVWTWLARRSQGLSPAAGRLKSGSPDVWNEPLPAAPATWLTRPAAHSRRSFPRVPDGIGTIPEAWHFRSRFPLEPPEKHLELKEGRTARTCRRGNEPSWRHSVRRGSQIMSAEVYTASFTCVSGQQGCRRSQGGTRTSGSWTVADLAGSG